MVFVPVKTAFFWRRSIIKQWWIKNYSTVTVWNIVPINIVPINIDHIDILSWLPFSLIIQYTARTGEVSLSEEWRNIVWPHFINFHDHKQNRYNATGTLKSWIIKFKRRWKRQVLLFFPFRLMEKFVGVSSIYYELTFNQIWRSMIA